MLEAFFQALSDAQHLPPLDFEWDGVWELLMALSSPARFPRASRIIQEIISRRFHSIFRKHQSVPHLCALGQVVAAWIPYIEEATLFSVLDEIMVDMCDRHIEGDGINSKDLQEWNELRLKIIMASQHYFWRGEVLPYNHFRSLHPCPMLDSLPESDVHATHPSTLTSTANPSISE
jgi:hypothetical protein